MDAILLPLVAAIVLAVLVGVVFLALVRVRRQPPTLDDQTAEQLADRAPTLPVPGTDDEVLAGAPQIEDAAPSIDAPPAPVDAPAAAPVEPPTAPAPRRLSPGERFRARLGRARSSLGGTIASIFRGGIGEDVWEELEDSLIAADVGVDATLELVAGLQERVRAENIRSGPEALALLKEILRLELGVADRTLARREGDQPTVWLFTGVNGTGKTTSIGKLAARERAADRTCVLAAADTFRAAATDQLQAWGDRSNARVIRQDAGADPAAVAFDGWNAAISSGADLLMVDTAGRLQNKRALMDELGKVKRVLDREAGHVDEVLLVLDATTGQNGLSQATAFAEAVDVSGVVLTKLDSTGKGGIVIAIQRQLGLPVKLVGLGEDVDDLAEFDPDAFIDALFAEGAQQVDIDMETAAAEER